jgi:formylglycine-generating enzyme required for sulfatase activity
MEDRVGKYEIVEMLGTGTLSAVYRAREQAQTRVVALKVLHEQMQPGQEPAERFLGEMRKAAALEHANLALIHDFGIEGGRPFVASELLGGRDLKSLLAGRYPFTLPQKLHIALEVAKGLQHAHDQGLVHRDVKPANVHLLQDGTVKLLDLGSTRLEGERVPQLLRAGSLSGHVSYLSPEQLRGEALTPATDVFSFGSLFFELLTNGRLFDGENAAAISAQILGFDPRTMDMSRVPEGLRELLESCLKRSVEDRLESFDIIVVELNRIKGLLAQDNRPPALPDNEPVSVFVARARAKVVGITAPRAEAKGGVAPPKAAAQQPAAVAAPQAPRRAVPHRVPQVPPPRPPSLLSRLVLGLLLLGAAAALVVAAVAVYLPPWLNEVPYGPELLRLGRLVRIVAEPLVAPYLGEPAPQPSPTEAPAPAESPTPEPLAAATPQPADAGVAPVPTRKPRTPAAGTAERPSPDPAASPEPVEASGDTLAEAVPTAVELNRWVPGEPAAVSLPNGLRLELAWIPKGSFEMGCSPGDEECNGDERPNHQVFLDGFWIGRHEVMQDQWKAVMGSNPSTNEGGERPVESVRWEEAREFTRKLGQELRLPTEAEWEYAARGGLEAATYGSLDEIAWTSENSGSESHPAGLKRPNRYGLYDMLGNVWEWCDDRYDLYPAEAVTNPYTADGEYGVSRGGSYFRAPRYSRASARNGVKPAYLATDLGFRVARSGPLQ